ncbi:MAG TPA: ammonia channel protein, partial [Anaeromyxobacteraceae bacterium]|nr:ammonia channel protein [Anaeromyxobacteraceae bacterium]
LALFGKQAVGVAVTMVWAGGVSFLLLKLVSLVTPLRAEEQDEWTGLDQAETGERGYISADLEGAGGAPVAAHDHGPHVAKTAAS